MPQYQPTYNYCLYCEGNILSLICDECNDKKICYCYEHRFKHLKRKLNKSKPKVSFNLNEDEIKDLMNL